MGASFELTVELGEPLNEDEVEAEVINEAPIIYGEDVKLYIGDTWDKSLHKIMASDKEDGDLSEAIKIKENNIKLDDSFKAVEKGEYKVVFEVTDSKGAKAEKEFTVIVDAKKEGSSNSNDENNSINLPNTGAIIGGTTLGIGGVLTLLGASMFKKRKK